MHSTTTATFGATCARADTIHALSTFDSLQVGSKVVEISPARTLDPTVTVAVPEMDGFVVLVARTVTVPGFGPAVNIPVAASMAPPFADQVTVGAQPPPIVALNWWLPLGASVT